MANPRVSSGPDKDIKVAAALRTYDGELASVQAIEGYNGLLATETKQDAILTALDAILTAQMAILAELAQKLEAGGQIALDSASLAALESVTIGGSVDVSNFPATPAAQVSDSNNSAVIAAPGAAFVGAWTATRGANFVRQLVVLASTVSSGLGGTFVFQYGEDGSTATISETRTIADFATVRDFDLINAGAYFRVSFEPDRVLTGGELVFVSTTQRRINDGAFVRLANQQIEEANAAMGQAFSYLKAFDESTGKSVNIRPTDAGDLRVGYESPRLATLCYDQTIAVSGTYATAYMDVKNYAGLTIAASATLLGTGYLDWSNDGAAVLFSNSTPFVGNASFTVPVQAQFARLRFANLSASAAHAVFETFGAYAASTLFSFPVASPIDPSFPAALVKSLITGANPDGVYVNTVTGGTRTLSPATSLLAAGASYSSIWIDTEQYPTVVLLIAASHESAANGVRLEWSDTSTGTVVQTVETRSFRTGHIANGRLIRTATRARYLRIVFINGATLQTRFFLNLRLNPVPIVQSVGLIPPTAGQTGQLQVSTSADLVAPGALAGRQSMRLKNLIGSARPLYYGFSAGVTAANGDELAAGEAVDLDIDEFVGVYVICTSTAGGGVRCAWTELA